MIITHDSKGDTVLALCVCYLPKFTFWQVCWLFVCLLVSYDICLDDSTTKDRCHTINILQVHFWQCFVVQAMIPAFMTSSMMSPGHKVCQILKLLYLPQYLSYSVDQNSGNAHGYLAGIFNIRYHLW